MHPSNIILFQYLYLGTHTSFNITVSPKSPKMQSVLKKLYLIHKITNAFVTNLFLWVMDDVLCNLNYNLIFKLSSVLCLKA